MTPEKQIDLYEKMYEGMRLKDLDLLNDILTKDFTLTHMTGIVQTKTVWLQDIKNEQMRYFSYETEVIDVTPDVLIGQTRVDARIYNSRHTWPLQLTLTLENNKIKAAVATTY